MADETAPSPRTILGRSRIFTPEVINDIQMKAELGRYRMRGFSLFKQLPGWDELMFLPGTLTPEDTAPQIRQFMIDNRSQLLAQSALIAGGVLLFLLFLATLRNVLRRTEADTGELSAVMSGSAENMPIVQTPLL